MFGFLFGPDVVEFVSLDDRVMTFRCRKLYQIGQTARIKTDVPTAQGIKTVQVPVQIRTVRRVEASKEFICCGDVPAGSNQLEAVRLLIESLGQDDYKGARRRPRLKFSLRTMSKDFPGFRALSIDFNSLGLQVETEGPLENGRTVKLDMELGKSDRPRMLCEAIVRWCRPVDRRRYLVGLEFVGLDPELSEELTRFENLIINRQGDDITRKSIGFGEFDLQDQRPEVRTVPLFSQSDIEAAQENQGATAES